MDKPQTEIYPAIERSATPTHERLSLIECSINQQRLLDRQISPEKRKAVGHFATPCETARFMAGLSRRASAASGEFRILDPGAGCGILTAAICEKLAENSS